MVFHYQCVGACHTEPYRYLFYYNFYLRATRLRR